MSVQRRLREARIAKGYSYRAAAREMGLAWSSVFAWEKGEAFPHPKHFKIVAAFYGVGRSWLVDQSIEWHIGRTRRRIRYTMKTV